MNVVVFPFFLIVLLLGLCVTGVWIWSLIDCLTRSDESLEPAFGSISAKLVWALIIFFTGIIGSIIYFFVAGTKRAPKRGAPPPCPADSEEVRRILDMVAGGKITAAEGQRLLSALAPAGRPFAAGAPAPTPSHSAGRGLAIGCLVALLVPVLLIVVFFLFRMQVMSRDRQAMSLRQSQMIEEQVRSQMGSAPVHITTTTTVTTNAIVVPPQP